MSLSNILLSAFPLDFPFRWEVASCPVKSVSRRLTWRGAGMSAGRLLVCDPDGPLGTDSSQGAILYLWRTSSKRSRASAQFPGRECPRCAGMPRPRQTERPRVSHGNDFTLYPRFTQAPVRTLVLYSRTRNGRCARLLSAIGAERLHASSPMCGVADAAPLWFLMSPIHR